MKLPTRVSRAAKSVRTPTYQQKPRVNPFNVNRLSTVPMIFPANRTFHTEPMKLADQSLSCITKFFNNDGQQSQKGQQFRFDGYSKAKAWFNSLNNFQKLKLLLWLLIRVLLPTGGGFVLGYGLKDVLAPWLDPYLEGIQQYFDIIPASNYHVKMPNARIADLVDRQAVEELKSLLSRGNDKLIIIKGVEGSGKTELALAYGRFFEAELKERAPNELRTFAVLHAANLEILHHEYREFAKALGLVPENLSQPELIQQVNQQLILRKDWLIIFDGVKQFADIEALLPQDISTCNPLKPSKQKGQVIMTTSQSLKLEAQNIQLVDINAPSLRFSRAEAVTLIDKVLGPLHNLYNKDQEMKGELAETLAFLPLAIKRAAHYIKQENITVKAYLELFREQAKLKNANYFLIKDHELVNTISYRLAVAKLNIEARQILELAALFNTNNIERILFDTLYPGNIIQLAEIFEELRKYGLMEAINDKTYKLHGSVKKAIIEQGVMLQSKDGGQSCEQYAYEQFKKALAHIKRLISPDNRFLDNQFTHKLLLPHAERLLEQLPLSEALKQKDAATLISAAFLLDAMANIYTSAAMADASLAKEALLRAKKLLEALVVDNEQSPNTIDKSYETLHQIDTELPSAYARILFSLGRVYFYAKDEAIMAKNHAKSWIKQAAELMQLDNTHKDKKSMEAIIYEMNGTLYFELEESEPMAVENAIARYKSFLADETCYFNRGIPTTLKYEDSRQENDQGAYSRMVCHDQIAKGYQRLAELSDKNKSQWYELWSLFGWSKPEQKLQNVNKAIVHSTGGQYEQEHHEGALPLCYQAKHKERRTQPDGTQQEVQIIGYQERASIYLNTLAMSLLLNPQQKDELTLPEPLNQEINLTKLPNNSSQAEALFKYAIKLYQDRPANFAAADAHYGLAQVYWQQGDYSAAREHINQCIKVQESMKRSHNHADVKKALATQQLLNRPQTAQEVVEEQSHTYGYTL